MSITSIAGFIGQQAGSMYGICHTWTRHYGKYELDLNHDGYLDIYNEYLNGGSDFSYKSGEILFRENVNIPLPVSNLSYFTNRQINWHPASSVPEVKWHKSENDLGAKLGDLIQFGGTNVWLESVSWDDPTDPGSQQFTLKENFCGFTSEPIIIYVDSMPPMNGRTIDLGREVMDRFNCEHGLAPCKETDEELPITDVEYLSYEIEKFNTKHQSDLNNLHGFAQQMKDCKKVDTGALLSAWDKIEPGLNGTILKLGYQNYQKSQTCEDSFWSWLGQAYGIDQNFVNYIKLIREINI